MVCGSFPVHFDSQIENKIGGIFSKKKIETEFPGKIRIQRLKINFCIEMKQNAQCFFFVFAQS